MNQRILVSSSDIADMASVGMSAVSQWKRRYNDFPIAVITNKQFTLYYKDEIVEWLTKRGKIGSRT